MDRSIGSTLQTVHARWFSANKEETMGSDKHRSKSRIVRTDSKQLLHDTGYEDDERYPIIDSFGHGGKVVFLFDCIWNMCVTLSRFCYLCKNIIQGVWQIIMILL
jgi:hypothetical protein